MQHEHTPRCLWSLDLGVPFMVGHDAFKTAQHIEIQIMPQWADHAASGFGFRDMQFDGLEFAKGQELVYQICTYLTEQGYPAPITSEEVEASQGACYGSKPERPYVILYCQVETDAEALQAAIDDNRCPVAFSVGPAHDRSSVHCIKDIEMHEDATYNDMHVGDDPHYAGKYVVWQGGGYVAGDPLPRANTMWSTEWEASETYARQIENHYRTLMNLKEV